MKNENININVTNKDNNSSKIFVKYSPKDHLFTLTKNNSILGTFIIPQLIKYITKNISNEFLKSVEYKSSLDLIEKYICKCDDDNEINIVGHLDSPLMGNIEILMKIYSELSFFETNIISSELEKNDFDDKIKKIIIQKVHDFTYLILNHALKVVVNISNIIKNENNRDDLKTSLVKYSIFIMNKINHLLYENMNQRINDHKVLEIELEQIKKLKGETNDKINLLQYNIDQQNEKIDKILEFVNVDDIYDFDDLQISQSDIHFSQNSLLTNQIDKTSNIELFEGINDNTHDDINNFENGYTESNNSETQKNIVYLSDDDDNNNRFV